MDYNIVEYLNKLKANILVMDTCMIPWKKEFLLQYLKSVENPMTITDQGRNPTPIDPEIRPTVNAYSEDKKGKPFVPPFLLTFEVFKIKLHNCLVES
jgi:hypothetical protein